VVSSPANGIALQVRETDSANRYTVNSQGQLHLVVLTFGLEVGAPIVIGKTNKTPGASSVCSITGKAISRTCA
jgi:predicted membrane GTPase involved in stress response